MKSQQKPAASEGEPAAPAQTTAAAAAPEAAQATYLSPTDYLPRAKNLARGWRAGAELLSIEAGPASKGFIDLKQDAKLEYVFGTSDAGNIPGKAASNEQYLVSVGREGPKGEQRVRPGGLIAAEPVCTFHEAYTKAIAAGLDASQPLNLSYRHEASAKREIWVVRQADGKAERKLDGASCTILTR